MAAVRHLVLTTLLIGVAACTGREATPANDTTTFDERVAVFLRADSAALAAARAAHGEEDYYAVADDMMWYRAEAWDWLERNGVPVVDLEGRPALSFVVNGVPTPFDFSAQTTLDVVVLYEPGQAPIALAPVDVSMRAPEYFGL